MIFVSVGSTYNDYLIKAIDIIAKRDNEKIVAQIGYGEYIPKNVDWFRYSTNIDQYYKNSNIIICSDGAGTLYRCLELGKKIISVRIAATQGVKDLGRKLEQDGNIIYIEKYNSVNDLVNLISKSLIDIKSKKIKKYVKIDFDILKFNKYISNLIR